MYYIPRDGNLQSYRDFIMTLPVVDSPQAFGQHPNSDMASLMEENQVLCETLMSLQGQSSGVAEEHKEDKVLTLISRILQKVPELIDYDTTVRNIGSNRTPLNVVLLQEVIRHFHLILQPLENIHT